MVNKKKILNDLNLGRYKKLNDSDIILGLPNNGWSGIAITYHNDKYSYLLAKCEDNKVYQYHVKDGLISDNVTLLKDVVAYVQK